MTPNPSTAQTGERLRLALDMFESGARILRARLRWRHPRAATDLDDRGRDLKAALAALVAAG